MIKTNESQKTSNKSKGTDRFNITDSGTFYTLINALVYKESEMWYTMDEKEKNNILKLLLEHDDELKKIIGCKTTIKEYMELTVLYTVVNGFSGLEEQIRSFIEVYPDLLNKKFSFYDHKTLPNFEEGHAYKINFGGEKTLIEIVNFLMEDKREIEHMKKDFGSDYETNKKILEKYSKNAPGIRT